MDSMKERAEEIAKLAGIELSFGAMRNSSLSSPLRFSSVLLCLS